MLFFYDVSQLVAMMVLILLLYNKDIGTYKAGLKMNYGIVN